MRSPSRSGLPARVGVATAWAAVVLGCADLAPTRDVRVTIVDETGQPIPGALFYAHVADDAGPFAYRWAFAGKAGEVPDSAREPWKLPWRRGARLTMVALAPGRRPAVRDERQGRVVSDGAVMTLEPGGPGTPELDSLGLPFPAASPLAAQWAEPSEAPLRAAFEAALRSQGEAASPPGATGP